MKKTMQWLLFGAEKGEVSWSNLSSPCESGSRSRHWSPEAGQLAPGQSAASIGPVCKCLQVSFSCDRVLDGIGGGRGIDGKRGRGEREEVRQESHALEQQRHQRRQTGFSSAGGGAVPAGMHLV